MLWQLSNHICIWRGFWYRLLSDCIWKCVSFWSCKLQETRIISWYPSLLHRTHKALPSLAFYRSVERDSKLKYSLSNLLFLYWLFLLDEFMLSINQCVLFLFPTASFCALKKLKIRFKEMLRFDDFKNFVTCTKCLYILQIKHIFKCKTSVLKSTIDITFVVDGTLG